MKMMLYKHALELYSVYNSEEMNDDWMDLNHQQNFNRRIQCVQIIDKSRLRVGRNVLMNRSVTELARFNKKLLQNQMQSHFPLMNNLNVIVLERLRFKTMIWK